MSREHTQSGGVGVGVVVDIGVVDVVLHGLRFTIVTPETLGTCKWIIDVTIEWLKAKSVKIQLKME